MYTIEIQNVRIKPMRAVSMLTTNAKSCVNCVIWVKPQYEKVQSTGTSTLTLLKIHCHRFLKNLKVTLRQN